MLSSFKSDDSSTYYRGVAYGSGRWVAVGTEFAYSDDGTMFLVKYQNRMYYTINGESYTSTGLYLEGTGATSAGIATDRDGTFVSTESDYLHTIKRNLI